MTRLIWFDRGSWYWSKLLAYLSDYDFLFWLTANASKVLLWILCGGTRFLPDKKWILGVWAFGVGIYNPSPQLRNDLCKHFDIYIVSLLNCYRFKSNMVNIEWGVLLGLVWARCRCEMNMFWDIFFYPSKIIRGYFRIRNCRWEIVISENVV